jgi:hypothetical protein
VGVRRPTAALLVASALLVVSASVALGRTVVDGPGSS